MFLPPESSATPTPDALTQPPEPSVTPTPDALTRLPLSNESAEPDAPTQPSLLNEFEDADAATRSAICSPLPPRKTLVVYHPHSKLPPKVIDTGPLQHPASPGMLLDGMFDDEDDPPYFPFRTLGDFEQTEFFVKNNFSDRQINKQLQLLTNHTRPPYPGGGISLSSACEMHKLLLKACKGCEQPEASCYCYHSVHPLTGAVSSRLRKSQYRTSIAMSLSTATTMSGFDQRLMRFVRSWKNLMSLILWHSTQNAGTSGSLGHSKTCASGLRPGQGMIGGTSRFVDDIQTCSLS